jgi:universal stress protein A
MSTATKLRNKGNQTCAGRETSAGQTGVCATDWPVVNIRSILVPVDFSEPSIRALRFAIRFAERFAATITLLHVVEPVASPDFASTPLAMEESKLSKMAKRKLDVLGKAPPGAACPIERKLVRSGKAFNVITEAAKEFKVDLIIIATHGYTGLKHVLMGSTAERVVRHASCPVLTLRDPNEEKG